MKMESLSAVYILITIWILNLRVFCVGPLQKSSPEKRPTIEESHPQNVAILEELRTITELVLRNQHNGKSEPESVPLVHDCSTLRDAGIKANGVYSVFPFTFKVFCDMTTDGGGWTVIQRRVPSDIHEDFNRPWNDYKMGFGDLQKEFWLGLDALHQLTYSWAYELRIEMMDYELGPKIANYKIMSVGPETDGYKLQVGNYTGNAGDALSMFHSGRRFSTLDKDQDLSLNKSCASEKQGGWWFHACYAAHLNGVYPLKPKRESSSSVIRWWSNRENVLVLTAVEMKIRRRRNGNTSAKAGNINPETDITVSSSDEDDTKPSDYEFTWMKHDEEIFVDPNTDNEEYDYNVTDHNGRSDISPWWMSQLPGFD